MKDITLLGHVQWRATKFILNDYSSSYKFHLAKLGMLPLMYAYKIPDIILFIKSLKFPNNSFNILGTNYIRLSRSKLYHKLSPTIDLITNTYFYRLPRSWNSLSVIDTSLPIQVIKNQLKTYFWNHFVDNFDTNNNCMLHILCPCSRCSISCKF